MLAAILVLLGATGVSPIGQRLAGDTPQPPNIILIVSDDQGYGDVGFHNNPSITTPVLDALARESVELTHFYSNPMCAPTRASL